MEVALDKTLGSVEDAAKGMIVGNLIFTVFFAISFKSMWYLLGVMQVVVLLKSYTAWPALGIKILDQIMQAITLEPIVNPILNLGKSKFEVADEYTSDEYMKSQGMSRTNVTSEIGVFYIALIAIGLLLIFVLIALICVKRFACCKKVLITVKRKLFFTTPLQYVIQGYFRIAGIYLLLLIINVKKEEKFHLLLAYSSIVLFFVLWPIWTLFFLLKNYKNLDDPKFKQKYHALYDDLR